MAVNWGDIYEVIYLSNEDTVIAAAFRRAVGLPAMPPKAKLTARVDRYSGAERLMSQRYGVAL